LAEGKLDERLKLLSQPHSITINIKGESFRLKEKLKAGLLRPKLEAPSSE
jgi:hypothetical protein